MHCITVRNGDTSINVAIEGEGPLILCVHGWPEFWFSWRSQMKCFSARGYKIAAMDVRGYGESSKPVDVASYTMRNLTGDVAAVIDEIGGGRAILFRARLGRSDRLEHRSPTCVEGERRCRP